MTLVIRLVVVALLGVALFFGYVKFGEPRLRELAMQQAAPVDAVSSPLKAPAPISDVSVLFGEYRAITPNGRYALLLDGKGAELHYIDKHGKQYAYRGHYTVDGTKLVMDWSTQRVAGTWTPMQKYEEQMKIESHDSISSTHGTFDRAKNRRAS